MRKSHERHSEPQAKNPTMAALCKCEILRLAPQDPLRNSLLAAQEQLETGTERAFKRLARVS